MIEIKVVSKVEKVVDAKNLPLWTVYESTSGNINLKTKGGAICIDQPMPEASVMGDYYLNPELSIVRFILGRLVGITVEEL